jgi:hypothetical protein
MINHTRLILKSQMIEFHVHSFTHRMLNARKWRDLEYFLSRSDVAVDARTAKSGHLPNRADERPSSIKVLENMS